MKNTLLLFTFLFSGFLNAQNYPEAKKIPTTFSKHGISFQDDYSWMEEMNSAEVRQWVEAENAIAEEAFESSKKQYNSISKIKEYLSLSSNSLPNKKGKYFFTRNRIDKNLPSVLFYRKDLNDAPKEIFNPYKVTNNKNVFLDNYYPSKNSVYLALTLSQNGGDRYEIHFADITKTRKIDEIVKDVKFSNIVWNKDLGVFYKKNLNQNTFATDSTYQLFYHRIGTEQIKDQLILDTSKEESSVGFFARENKLFIVENSKDETAKTYYYCSLDNENFTLEKFLDKDTSGNKFITYSNGRVYFSSKNYDWGEVRSFDIKNMQDEKVVIPQIYMNLLESAHLYEDYIICKYKTLGKYYINIHDKDGKFIRKFDAPHGMDFDIRFYNPETKDLYVSFYSYTISFQNFKLNLVTGEVNNYYNNYIRPKVTLFPLDYFDTKTITYKSRDNKDIPITIVHKKGIKLDGNNPTLLKAYGGFGVVSGPDYDTGLLYFLEKGGVYAYAEIRGGGEKGLKWHTEGKGMKKSNSINDFIDASEFLIHEKYTSANKLAITGASHGGLIVGAALVQRPELYKLAIPVVGRFDVLSLEKYTSGRFHLDEYGNPNNKIEYENMLKYSPYQNIKEDVNYPTTLIITSENDDRVPPLQSYKFAAQLQNRAAQKNPIYLKTHLNSGHYGKISNFQDAVNEKATFYNFLLYHLNN